MSYNLNQIDPDAIRELYAEPRAEGAPARPQRFFAAVATLVVMALFAGGLWFAYVEGLRHANAPGDAGEAPLIRADARPIKVKPANPGGMAIPDRNLAIYGEGHPSAEHLLPPPEQPMPRPAPPAEQATPPSSATVPRPNSSPPSPAPAAAAPSAMPLPPSETEPTPATAKAGTVTVQRPTPARRDQADRAAGRVQTAAIARQSSAAETAAAPPGAVRLQLGSVRNAASAREDWERIRRENSDLLGGLSAATVRADLGGKGVYFRIQTGPIGDMARAQRICAELRQRHQGCMIVR